METLFSKDLEAKLKQYDPADVEFDLVCLVGSVSAAAINLPDAQARFETQVNYEYVILGIEGFVGDPATNPVDIPTIEINITNSRDQKRMFKKNINFAALANPSTGGGRIKYLAPAYKRLPANTNLSLEITRIAANAIGAVPAWAGAEKVVGVLLHCLKFRSQAT